MVRTNPDSTEVISWTDTLMHIHQSDVEMTTGMSHSLQACDKKKKKYKFDSVRSVYERVNNHQGNSGFP